MSIVNRDLANNVNYPIHSPHEKSNAHNATNSQIELTNLGAASAAVVW